MKRALAPILLALALSGLAGCSTVAGGMIGAGVGSLSGNTTSGMLIGAGIGTMID
ncbi:hypothetical protein [Aeromonas sanarellii]|uniref:hypothetical protein n=1 Tax=Aeromonas sanarellii TaxID=633415 RepID=UPI000A87EC56|nr:hypothetical protein [Aeromonas sanarellii]